MFLAPPSAVNVFLEFCFLKFSFAIPNCKRITNAITNFVLFIMRKNYCCFLVIVKGPRNK